MHGRSQSSGSIQVPSRRLFGFLPSRSSEERIPKRRRKVENNPRGLTELYSPPEPQVDFVFVHGLGGGSVKTWCYDQDLNLFWPKEWIAIDEDLRHRVRTSSFGYANDRRTTKSSQLTLHDFGRDLIYQLDNSPYLRKNPHTSIVLIGHSLGGLVIKKACLLAYQQRKKIADRLKCVIFLATPHRGSSAAELLNGILDLAGWDKKFVEELCRDSSSLQVINDEFRHVARLLNLRLTSLYETQGMIKSRLIVEQSSATLGYDNEEVNMVFADHRNICKFKRPDDEDYLNLRNALLRITDDLTTQSQMEMLQETVEQMTSIEIFLNINHRSQFDLDQQRDKQIEQSCLWLERRSTFQGWLNGCIDSTGPASVSSPLRKLQRRSTVPLPGHCSVYWLTGNAGAGKSVCAAYVITLLQSQKHDCAYHFFRAGEKAKTRVSSMLLSIAFQMAEMHPSIRETLVGMQKARKSFDGDDDAAVWRKLFVNGILKAPLQKPQFWIVDAMDECIEMEKFVQKLNAFESSFDLRIFLTSRQSSKLESLLGKHNIDTSVDSIQFEDTKEDTKFDMRLYLDSRLECLPVDNPIERKAMVEKLLSKANGCFLWLGWVSHELEGLYSEDSIDEVLSEVPSEMSELYKRSVESLGQLKRLGERRAAEAVLLWCAYAIRPLTLTELTTALNQYDGPSATTLDPVNKNGYKVTSLKAIIEDPCSGLLFADGRGCVQFVHATAREYVLVVLKEKEFPVDRAAGNQKLTMACLRCLRQEVASVRKPSFSPSDSAQMRSRAVFSSYASIAFSEHFAASSSKCHQLLRDVAEFMSTSALAWIE
jgi:esterase/lipase